MSYFDFSSALQQLQITDQGIQFSPSEKLIRVVHFWITCTLFWLSQLFRLTTLTPVFVLNIVYILGSCTNRQAVWRYNHNNTNCYLVLYYYELLKMSLLLLKCCIPYYNNIVNNCYSYYITFQIYRFTITIPRHFTKKAIS